MVWDSLPRPASVWFLVLALGIPLTFTPFVRAEGEPPEKPKAESPAVTPVPGRDAILLRMGEIIRKAILREDTEHPVFHGCIDWHSSVHGHWALFRIARILPGQQAGAVGADDSLSEKGIEAEIRFLRSHPRFEMPYGRAWF
ncbi:MAG: DUF2891 family protein, partial [Planctomycetota bacterium]